LNEYHYTDINEINDSMILSFTKSNRKAAAPGPKSSRFKG